MHLIEWLVSAWPKRCLTATWTNLYLQGSGKVCEIHQKNVTTVAALYSRTDPAPPANNMTFLAAGGINDHNMQLYIPNIQYMSYLRPCPRVHSISLQQFFYSIYIYIEKLWKKTLKWWRLADYAKPISTCIHWASKAARPVSQVWDDRIVAEFLFSSAESYVDLLTNPASIEDVWHLLFLEMRWGLLYNEKGSSLSYWSYLGIIDIRTMAFPRASRVLLELEKLPQCHRQLQWRYSHVCRHHHLMLCPKLSQITHRPNANISWNVGSVFSRDFSWLRSPS